MARDDYAPEVKLLPMTWVKARDNRWDSLSGRWKRERGQPPFPMFSKWKPGAEPGWFFPDGWIL